MTKTSLTRLTVATLLLSCNINCLAAAFTNVFTPYKAEVEIAVEKGLNYLTAIQFKEGHFPGHYGKSTGIVSLVGMSFLSKGYTPTHGPHSNAIDKCINYLLNNQRLNGLIADPDSRNEVMYSHNIATLFLSEVSGMVNLSTQVKIDHVLAKALRLIIAAQQIKKPFKHQGGWRYHPDSTDSDVSCSGWALMALRSAKMNGAPVPDESIADAIKYILKNSNSETGTFGYMDTRTHSKTLTGAGILCLELSGFHGKQATIRAGDYIMSIFQIPMNWQYYGNYYNSQAMFQLGGKYWSTFAQWFYPTYLSKQRSNGSWAGSEVSDTYSTIMTILAFTVPYRQLPIYQRDETVSTD